MTGTYYFYNGFGKPQEIDIHDVVITDNYLGDLTKCFLEEHEEWKKENDEDYNFQMHSSYGILRNPTFHELQEINRGYGLGNQYIEEFQIK